MSSWFTTTGSVKHVTSLPAGITLEMAMGILHNHVSFIKCDPHLITYESMPRPPPDAKDALPEECTNSAVGEPAYYSVTDKVQKLPAGLWDSEVISTYEFVNLKKGLFARLRSPLSVVMDTVWEIQKDEKGGLIMVETVQIKASRLLIGVVKGMCESAWRDIHGKMIRVMGGEEP